MGKLNFSELEGILLDDYNLDLTTTKIFAMLSLINDDKMEIEKVINIYKTFSK